MRVLSVVVASVLLLHVELLELVPCNHLVSLVLDVLVGGEYRRLQRSAFRGELLRFSPCKHLVNFVLDVVGGGEGGVSSFLLFHVNLLSPVPSNDTLANLLGILFLIMWTQV